MSKVSIKRIENYELEKLELVIKEAISLIGNIDELIKKEYIDDFWNKVYDLLALKYPEFIVNGIKSGDGINAYEIKENEIVIYFMNYTIEPIINELISIKVNYNEIKDYIDFTCVLDNMYTNEDGFNYSKSRATIQYINRSI